VRHQGTGQTADEAAKISTSVNIVALREYTKRIEDRTREVLASVDAAVLESALEPATINRVVFREGFAHSNAAWIEKAYAGWSRGKCLIHFALTHTYQHVGEIAVLASLQGADAFGF